MSSGSYHFGPSFASTQYHGAFISQPGEWSFFLEEIRYSLLFSRAPIQNGTRGSNSATQRKGALSCVTGAMQTRRQEAGAFCPSLWKLTRSWMVLNIAAEDDKNTTTQLGWTQEFDLPELGVSLLFWTSCLFKSGVVIERHCGLDTHFKRRVTHFAYLIIPNFQITRRQPFKFGYLKKKLWLRAMKLYPSLPKVCTKRGTNNICWDEKKPKGSG